MDKSSEREGSSSESDNILLWKILSKAEDMNLYQGKYVGVCEMWVGKLREDAIHPLCATELWSFEGIPHSVGYSFEETNSSSWNFSEIISQKSKQLRKKFQQVAMRRQSHFPNTYKPIYPVAYDI